MSSASPYFSFFFFTDTAPTEIYTLSLHDALPIWAYSNETRGAEQSPSVRLMQTRAGWSSSVPDRKSTRLNSSHGYISYAVFCLKKKKKNTQNKNINTKT